VAHLAPALAARGHQVTVLSRSLGETDTDVTVKGVRVVRVRNRSAPPDLWQDPFNPRQAAQAREYYDRAYTVALALESDKSLAADIIEAPDWGGEAALVRLVCPNVPYVVKFHTPAKLVFAWNGAGVSGDFVESLHALERVAVRNALGFTSPSRWLVPEVEKLFELPSNLVEAIPNPFVPEAAQNRQPSRNVLYVGRLEARKGVMEAVAPMVRVLRSLPDVRWRLAGADTASGPGGVSMKRALLDRIPADLHHRVDILGSLGREQLSVELASAGAVLLPSRKENFPYACLEAMAAGAPVIGSRNGGMGEMIASGRTGLLVDPTEPDAVFDAALRVLEQPLFAEALSGAAQTSVLECYRPEVIAPQVEHHYQKVIAQAQSTP
jgi:glycosyltransferase involved in cell wall biosynthesis